MVIHGESGPPSLMCLPIGSLLGHTLCRFLIDDDDAGSRCGIARLEIAFLHIEMPMVLKYPGQVSRYDALRFRSVETGAPRQRNPAPALLPLSGSSAGRGFSVEGRQFPPSENVSASYRLTCPGYFKTMGISMLKGRDFEARDATTAPGVVIINEETAKAYWPNEDPIGKRIKLGGPDSPWMTIVGVAANVRHFGLDGEARREMFRPYSQGAWPVMTIVAKTAADPAAFAGAARAALLRIDPDLPVSRVTTMEAIERDSTGSRRFPMMLLGTFGLIALLLAMIGVYGVVNYIVSQRTREIGIRMALGARGGQVLALVVRGALRPVLAGLALGVIGAFFAARLLGTLLFHVQPGDPLVLAGIAGMLGASAIAASLVPARRASRLDPIKVLRTD